MLKAGGGHRRHRARPGLRLGSSRSRWGKAGGGGLSCTYLGDFLDVSDRFEPQLNFAQGSHVSGIFISKTTAGLKWLNGLAFGDQAKISCQVT